MKIQSIQDLLSPSQAMQFHQASNIPFKEDVPEELPDSFFEMNEEEDFAEQSEAPDFQENLAEHIDSSTLKDMAAEFLEKISEDEDSRQPWMDMIETIRDQLGIGESASYDQPFPGSSTVVYPIITKAQIQFQARALPEIYPTDPVKALVLGEETPELADQAKRVADTMNWQIQYQDKGNKKDFRKMLWWLPLTGSTFRHVFHDPLKNMNTVRFVPVEDFIVPYRTTSLEDAPHYSNRFFDSKNDVKKLINLGFYVDIPLSNDGDTTIEEDNPVQKLRDDADGEVLGASESNIGHLQECYNVYIDYDLPDFEDVDENGDPTGIGLPYVFTIHARSRSILAIRRNWKQDDEYKTKRISFIHYKYQEGPGFYGAGLPHLIGSLQTAATGALRAFGDALAFSIMQAGWKLKDAKFSGSTVLSPGVFLDVDSTMDDINKAIKIANFPAPTPQMLEYIRMLDEQAQTIVSTQDVLTGDSNPQNAPVGTTLAIIEQAQKVISAQHKSLYESFSEELQVLADWNYDFLPDDGSYKVAGKAGVIRREDFNGDIDVIPTADPSVSSFQQRMAITQATMQIAADPTYAPAFRDEKYELLKRALTDMKVPDIDQILYTDEEIQQKIQQAQQNPPLNPELMKVQIAQQDSQVKAQTAQANAQQMQADNQLEQGKLDIKNMELALKEKQIDMKYATDDKMIDARFLGTVAPALQRSSDALAMQNISHEQEKAIQQQDQEHQMTMQRMQAAQAAQQQAAIPTPPPAEGQASQAPDPQAMHDQMMATQHGAAQSVAPTSDKQGMLMRIMNKIRGR